MQRAVAADDVDEEDLRLHYPNACAWISVAIKGKTFVYSAKISSGRFHAFTRNARVVMKLLRKIFVGLLLLGCSSSAMAQLITPVDGSGESVASDVEAPKKRAPVLAAKWPFKFGKKLFGKNEAADPFLQGATAQRQLATQITGRGEAPITPPPPQPISNTTLPASASYPWPSPVGSGTEVVVPTSASSINTWHSPPVESNAAVQLPSGTNQSSADPAVAQSSPTTQRTSSQRFSHFAASDARNPPPAAVPIPSNRSQTTTAVASSGMENGTSVNVPAAALIPDNSGPARPEIATPEPRFSPSAPTISNATPPAVAIPTARPTTLAAGPPVQPPAYQQAPLMPPQSAVPSVAVAQTQQSSTVQRPAPGNGGFSVNQMDQDIWGPSLGNTNAPAASDSSSIPRSALVGAATTGSTTRAQPPLETTSQTPTPPPTATLPTTTRSTTSMASTPSALTPPLAATPPAASRNAVASRDDDFVTIESMNRIGPSATAPNANSPAAPLANSPPSYSTSSPSAPAAAPTTGPSSSPFKTGPSVALLDAPVLKDSPPVPPNALVHGTLDEGTRVLAIVGDQSILAGDLLGQINEMLAPYKGQAPEEQLAIQRDKIIQEMLPRLVERKLIFYDFIKKIPVEKIPEIEQEVFKHFNENRLPKILEKSNLNSPAELDSELRRLGSSLANQQRMFFEQMVAAEAVQREARRDDEVGHDQMLAYYNEHIADYSFPAKVRWERLAVDPTRFASHEQAYNAIARMGNEVVHGANLSDVARRTSQGPRAASGGQYDWTTQGSLKNKEIDRLLFKLPVSQMSKVVNGDEMYQIIRVIERVEAGKKPFTSVQNEIIEKIKKQRFEERVEAYVARLRNETYIWTSTSGEAAPTQVAQPPSGATLR